MRRFLPTPVNVLYRDAVNGRLSRREVIKRGSALGLSAGLMGTILRAESLGAQATPDADQPAGWSIEIPEGLRTDLDGVALSVVLDADGPGSPFDQACCDAFAEATGAEVEYIRGPGTADERLTFYLQTFAAEAADIDVAQIDVIWPGIMNPHAVDLTEMYEEQGATHFDRVVQNNTVDDRLIGIPGWTNGGLLYYRTDLLDEYGYDGPPTTWEELTEMAQTIMEGESADNPSFYGFTFQGAAYEGLTCNGLEWQFSYGGGEIIDSDGNVTVNNEQVAAALELARGWVGTIAPEAVTNYIEEDARGVWQGGNAAFHRNWPYAYSLTAEEGSELRDIFDIIPLPMGEGPDASNAGTLGGWQMMVSQYSEQQEAAQELAKFLTSPEIQRARAIERSQGPTIVDLYQDEDVLAANPFFGTLSEVLETGAVARPSTVSADLYGEVSIAYSTAVHELLTGQQDDIDGVLESLESDLENIMLDV